MTKAEANTEVTSTIGKPCYVMSMKEALKHGYTLEESERRLTKLIHDHFHPSKPAES